MDGAPTPAASPPRGPLRRLLVPSRREDPDEDAAVRTLNVIAWAVMGAALAGMAALLVVLPQYTGRWLVMAGLQVVIAAVTMVLARRGSTRAAALFIVIAFYAMGTFAIATSGGVRAPILVGILVFAVMASLTLGWRGGVAAAAVSAATIFLLAWMESAGMLPAPAMRHTVWSRAVLSADYVALCGVLVALATLELRRARDRARRGLEERRAVEQALLARNAELDALLRAGRAVASGLDFQRALFEVARTAGEALGSPESLIWEFLPETREMVCRCLWERVPVPGVAERQQGVRFDADLITMGVDSLLDGSVLQAHARDPRVSERDRASLQKWGHKSLLRVPLVTERALFGVMYLLEREHEREFTPDEVRLAGAIGEQAAVALENARLFTARKEAEEGLARLNTDLERRVELRTAQLRAANEEMEAFAYSVSHDLRGPLRAIDGFSALVLEDAGDCLAREDRDNLDRVRAAAQRMDVLIDALLSLSRLSRRQPQPVAVDLSAQAAVVVARLRDQEPGRDVDVVIAPGCTVVTDAELLEVVLTNLIGNAWKFTAGRERAHIEIGVRPAGDDRAFFVRDDGAGFDMAYAGQLFQPFHRLHGADEFPGTGIGLATVRRIVTRLGGACWAEGAEGEGATFFFALPEPEV